MKSGPQSAKNGSLKNRFLKTSSNEASDSDSEFKRVGNFSDGDHHGYDDECYNNEHPEIV